MHGDGQELEQGGQQEAGQQGEQLQVHVLETGSLTNIKRVFWGSRRTVFMMRYNAVFAGREGMRRRRTMTTSGWSLARTSPGGRGTGTPPEGLASQKHHMDSLHTSDIQNTWTLVQII